MGIKLVEQGGDADKMRPLDRVLKETDKDFIRKLETLYPQLSCNDIRLICLIRLGMPSGEISKLLNITMDSLHKSRYRLRKKMRASSRTDSGNFHRHHIIISRQRQC